MKKIARIPAPVLISLIFPLMLLVGTGCIPFTNPTYLDTRLVSESGLIGGWWPFCR